MSEKQETKEGNNGSTAKKVFLHESSRSVATELNTTENTRFRWRHFFAQGVAEVPSFLSTACRK
jgi:hypothetical protein